MYDIIRSISVFSKSKNKQYNCGKKRFFVRRRNMKVLILGSSAAGLACAEALRQKSDAEITIIGKESYKPYYRPALSHMILSNDLPSRFYLKPDSYYKDNNIKLVLDTEVTAIDRQNKKIYTNTGQEILYTKLVIALGSSNFVPPLQGVDKKGVFNLKYYSDLLKLNEYATNKQNITIIGGGLLGIEAAWAFKKAGKSVTIVEFLDRLMANQLSPAASALVEKEIEASGIRVMTGKSVKQILGDDELMAVLLESGEEVPTDILFYSIGVRPNISIAKAAGLTVEKGIVVNDKMQTSDNDIYAVGDCCQIGNMVPGIWPLALQTGKIAAENILGTESKLSINPPIALLKALDKGVYSAGFINGGDDYLEITEGDSYKAFAFKEGGLIGINLIADTRLSSKALRLLTEKISKEKLIEILKGN